MRAQVSSRVKIECGKLKGKTFAIPACVHERANQRYAVTTRQTWWRVHRQKEQKVGEAVAHADRRQRYQQA
jgi:hypothetical protein